MLIDVINCAAEALSVEAFETAVLDLLSREAGADVAFFMTKGANRPPTVAGLDAAVIGRALDGGERYAREFEPVKRAALATRGVAIDTEVFGLGAVQAAAYHRHLAAPIGGRHSLWAYLRLRGRVRGAIMLGRCGSAFREADAHVVEEMLPALAVAHASFGESTTCAKIGTLSTREREILGYLHLGYRNREIATACGTSPNTVRNQLASVFEKLGVTTRSEAVARSRP